MRNLYDHCIFLGITLVHTCSYGKAYNCRKVMVRLAKGQSSLNEEHENFSFYKRQGEFILREISRGALPPSKMTIRTDHHCFKCPLFLSVFYPFLLSLSQNQGNTENAHGNLNHHKTGGRYLHVFFNLSF